MPRWGSRVRVPFSAPSVGHIRKDETIYSLIAQLVEQSAVNRSVVGSSPTQGAIGVSPSGKATDSDSVIRRFESYYPCHDPLAQLVEHLTFNQGVPRSSRGWITMWPVRQAVKTPPFHGGFGGSNPHRSPFRAISSVGRALALQARCRQFEPVIAHHHYGPVV